MWCVVMNRLGGAIYNASFNYGSYNNGNGWYWVPVPVNVNLCASAPGYYQTCINIGTAPNNPNVYAYFYLNQIPPPPSPPGGGNCWS